MKKRTIPGLTVLLLFFSLSMNSFGWSGNEADQYDGILKNLYVVKTDQAIEIFIEIEGVYIHQVSQYTDPLRIAFDFSPVDQILSETYYEINEWSLMGIRIGQFHPSIVRVVFDFSESLLAYEVEKSDNILKISLIPIEEEIPPPPAPEPLQPVVEQPRKEIAAKPVVAPPPVKKGRLNTMIGLTAGSHNIPDVRFQEVYPGSALIYGLHLSRTFFSAGDFDVLLSVDGKIFSKPGAATVTEEEARFTMTPLSIGASLLWNTKYFILFGGGGLDICPYRETSPLYPFPGFVKETANGSHFQAGLFLRIPGLDALRAKFYYKSTKALTINNDIEVDLGGREFGFSLVYGFSVF
ncbi:MAG: AMIN domain-containing protein [Candidatus Aminicenantes bacterium]|nr:AMIN domain-containing protein [Candidatus Aminicenantes bacterium]